MKYTGLIEVMVESDRERQKSAGKKQTFRRVSGGGGKEGGGRLNYHWVGFPWVCYKGVYFQ